MGRVLQVVAPEARLRLEAHMVAEEILEVRFLAENVRGKPHSRLHVRAPAIKMQIDPVQPCHRRVHAVETDYREALVFRPNASLEPPISRFRQRRHIEYEATHVAQELPPHVID